jgi:hypothetical protein
VPTISSGRRTRPALIITVAVVAVAALAVAGFLLNGGRFTLGTVAEGPLEAGVDRQLTLPLRAQDKGAAWGSLALRNGSADSPIALDSVAFESTTGRLTQLTSPYVWDENRWKVSGSGSLEAYQLPLPAAWNQVPKHPLRGYLLKPATSVPAGDDAAVPEAEVVVEFGVPEKASGFKSVAVDYHIGTVAYRKTFQIGLVLCPPNDPTPCN